MKKTLILLSIAGALSIAGFANAASFDCAATTRVIDMAICASPKVSAMDSKMADLYREAMQHVSDKGGLREAQRKWIRDVRDKCSSERCLIQAYEGRIEKLTPGSGGYDVVGASDTGPADQAERAPASSTEYVEQLRVRYLSRISFETPYSRKAVMDFSIDCKAPDARSLPLINVMLAKLKSMDSPDTWMTTRVDSRGDDVRVYDQMVRNGRVVDEQLAFELDKWGTLQVKNVRAEAILNSCFGSVGPIWVHRK